MVANDSFREDLFYRIGEISILIPPLRDRDDDVILLAKTFLKQYREEYSAKVKGFSDDAIQAMLAYTWPGNIRELQNKLKSAVVLAEGQMIQVDELALTNLDELEQRVFNLREVREVAESKAIRQAYHLAEQNISKAADLLGVTRPTLYSLIDKYRLDDLKTQA
jgi:two-component system NtrC family response regulator